ncbi:MAG: hypothetical protein ABEJ93_01410 [Candidatus Nanohalobium sp.]
MADMKQYLVLIVGLLMAGGFAFGGMASYSSMVNTDTQNQQNNRKASLPNKTFVNGSFDLTLNQRARLARQNDVVFLSAIYNSTEGRKQFKGLQNISENFEDRAYISVVKASNSEIVQEFSITEYPNALGIGYKSLRAGPNGRVRIIPRPVEGELTSENIAREICNMFNEWGEIDTYCTSL